MSDRPAPTAGAATTSTMPVGATTIRPTTTTTVPPPTCLGLCVFNSNDPKDKDYCGVDPSTSTSPASCSDGIRVVVQCPSNTSSCRVPSNLPRILGASVPSILGEFDRWIGHAATTPSVCRSTLSSSINEFPCGVPRFTNAPVENLVSSSPRPFSTIASALGPEAAVLGPSSQPPPTDASSPAAPLVGGIVGGLVVVALLAFLLIQRSRRRPPPPSPDLEGVPYTAASIIFTPNPPAPVVASAADSSTPSFVRSDIDDDIILDANHSSSAASRLVASRPDLIELWMPSLDQVKPNPLKGGDKDLKVVTVHGHKLVVRTSSASGFLDAVQFIRRFRHPHITSVVGVGCLQTSQSEVAVVTEFLDQGSLGAYLSRTVELVPLTRLRLALDVGRALQYLHATHNLAYGGVHPDKILVYRDHAASFDENTIVVRAKLNVFHLMTHEQRHQQRHQKRHLYQPKRTCCIPSSGVPNFVPFLAPERRQRMDPPTKPSDVFALAVVVGMIWTNERPHAALYDQQGLVRGDVYLATHPEETFPYLEGKLTGMAPSLSRVLWQCWHVDPAARPTIDAVVATLEQLLS